MTIETIDTPTPTTVDGSSYVIKKNGDLYFYVLTYKGEPTIASFKTFKTIKGAMRSANRCLCIA